MQASDIDAIYVLKSHLTNDLKWHHAHLRRNEFRKDCDYEKFRRMLKKEIFKSMQNSSKIKERL